MSSIPETVSVCANCAQPLTGPYCARCGEEVFDPNKHTVRHFVTHTLAHEMLHLDGKIWRTLRALLFQPAFLTSEYCAGRRRRYVNPVRLLITAIIVYALLTQGGLLVTLRLGTLNLSIAPTRVRHGLTVADTVFRLDPSGLLQRLMAAKQQSVNLESEAVRDRFHAKLERFAQPLSFTNVLLLAVALYVLFHRRRPLLVEHGVFSMHLVSFMLFSSLLLVPGLWVLNQIEWVGLGFLLVVAVAQFMYLTVAIRRFYFASDTRRLRRGLVASAAALFIYLLNSAFITIVQVIGAALALWTL